MFSGANNGSGGSAAGEAAKGIGKGLLVKATLAVVLSQVGIVIFLLLLVLLAAVGVVGFSADNEPDCDAVGGPNYTSSSPSEEAVSDIPEDYYNLYKQAAEEYNIDWAVLAAVGKIESDHGRLDAPGVTEGQNQHGCCAGPMQFDNNYGNGGGTWGSVGYDANGDGEADIYDPEDAIPSAAKYLVDGGAPDDYNAALFQYNNAQWYVDDVMAQADRYRAAHGGGAGSEEPGTSPASLPFGGPLMSEAQAQEGGAPEGSGEPPQGWDLVDDTDKTMYYEIEDTSFASEFEAAAEEWNALGGVDIQPTPSGEQTDIVVSDASLGGPLGTTSSEGTIQFDPQVGEGIGSSARLSAAVHELGHALGFGNTTSESVMEESVAIGEENPTSPTDYDRELYKEVWGGSEEDADSTESSPTPPSEEVSRRCDEEGAGGSSPGSGGGVPAEGTGTGKEVVEEARRYDGVDYVLGGLAACKPGEQMDCTCLTLTVFKEFGFTGPKELPDSPQGQREYGEPVEGEPKAGDLIIYEDPGDGTGGHAGIATGDGGIFHCASAELGCLYTADYHDGGLTPVVEVRRLVDGGD